MLTHALQHCYCAFQIVASRTGWARVGTITTWVDEVLRPYANGRPFHLVMDRYTAHVHQAVADAVEGIGGGGSPVRTRRLYIRCTAPGCTRHVII